MHKVSEIVAELQISYATEIEIIQNYLANATDLEGARAEPIKELFDEQVQTDWPRENHRPRWSASRC